MNVERFSIEMVVYLNVRKRIQRLQQQTKETIGPSYLERESGVSKSLWAAIAKKPQRITLTTLQKMSVALQCTERDLVARQGVVDYLSEV
jgi:DNA-binding Xre family transcriptional regulator